MDSSITEIVLTKKVVQHKASGPEVILSGKSSHITGDEVVGHEKKHIFSPTQNNKQKRSISTSFHHRGRGQPIDSLL